MNLRLRLGPDAGHRVHALGPAGMNVWRPYLFPEGEHETDQDADDEDDSDDDSDDDSSGGDGKDKANEPTAREKALLEEKARHLKRRRAAEQRADELQKKLQELEAKDTPEAQRVIAENASLKKNLEIMKEQLQEARLNNAFLADNSYEWHNPARALRLADLSDVEIDQDGGVTGLKEALDALAKSDPYLLKSSGNGDSKDNKNKKDPAEGKPGSGDSANGNKGKPKGLDKAALENKYPGLRL